MCPQKTESILFFFKLYRTNYVNGSRSGLLLADWMDAIVLFPSTVEVHLCYRLLSQGAAETVTSIRCVQKNYLL